MSNESNIDQQFVEFIVKSLVGNPDAVSINRRIDEKGVLLELSVDPEDLGRVIGKRGATAQSIRTLLRALGTKNDARYNLKIIDPEGGNRTAPAPAPQDDAPADDQAAAGGYQDETTEEEQDQTAARLDELTAQPQEEAEAPADAPADESAQEEEPAPDRFDRTRRELEDLDDLDI